MIVYYGKLVRYKVLADQICDYFGQELECRNNTFDDDVVYPYFLWDIKGKLIAPTSYHANLWNNKIYQFKELEKYIPVPEFEVHDSILALLPFKKKVFITKETSLSGEGNIIYDGNLRDIVQFKESRFRVTKYIPHQYDVSLHIIILNDKKFFISPIVEQIIEGTCFRGGKYPVNLNDKVVGKIHEYCAVIAEVLYKSGYVGLCGIDFMICENNDVYLCELNPRKMGTTPFVSMQMEHDSNISLSCIEYYVNILGVLPEVKLNNTIGWKLRLIPYNKEHPMFSDRKYFNNLKGTKIYNDNYTKFSFEITKWHLPTMPEKG